MWELHLSIPGLFGPEKIEGLVDAYHQDVSFGRSQSASEYSE